MMKGIKKKRWVLTREKAEKKKGNREWGTAV